MQRYGMDLSRIAKRVATFYGYPETEAEKEAWRERDRAKREEIKRQGEQADRDRARLNEYNVRKEEAHARARRMGDQAVILDPPEWVTDFEGNRFIALVVYESGPSMWAIPADGGEDRILG